MHKLNLIILITFFFSVSLFSQNTKKDVVFISFKSDKCFKKDKIGIKDIYKINFNKYDIIVFRSPIYADFDEMEKENPLLNIEVNKSFIRKNKDQIMSLSEIKKLGYNKAYRLFRNVKHILLIEKNGKNKVTIKKVLLNFSMEE